ncbi:uncharacterized protein [Montipora capricornis]|uniref:uncharacterized protein n=1 Tax=Montipora capricornis TaxID=246305 RepID=UPI0035F18BCB
MVTMIFLLASLFSLADPSHSRQFAVADTIIEDRLEVIDNQLPPLAFVFAFDARKGKLRFRQYLREKWFSWQDLDAPDGRSIVSNPVAAHDVNNQTNVFCLCDDGQVYYRVQMLKEVTEFGKWQPIGSKLPFEEGVSLRGKDTLSVLNYENNMALFSRSMTKASRFYWTQNINGNWPAWNLIGGSSVSLKTDAAVAYNSFSKHLEAFAVMENNKMYRTWQTGPTKWVTWDETGYGAPETQYAPVVHSMSHSGFNGVLNVFIYGSNGYVHHIWQTTCDKVPNPWGWCTWSVWYKISDKIPSINPLSIGANIHLGIEIFTMGNDGYIWHMWELERGGVWNPWELVTATEVAGYASQASVRNDEKGWWTAFVLNSDDNIMVIEQNRSLSLSVSSVPFGISVKVSWKVPVDEATNKDWIGVYPSGADNHMYVDYQYVGGGQNPGKDAKPMGSVTFKSYLPNGQYVYRYLANRRYFDAVSALLTATNGTTDKEWVQVYRGIAAGLGKEGFNFEKCVEDGNHTVELFKESFAAFRNNDVSKGLQLIGAALMDVVKAFEDCGKTDIAKELEKLATDFIHCVEGMCVHFVIDVVDEILILFENAYEIYGDIKGASNSFNINAYEQGGYCIGRVISACITLPQMSK